MTTGSVAPTCSTCRFRDANDICRRFPPVAGVGADRLWPRVTEEDWCGEHPVLQTIEANTEITPEVTAGGAAIRPPPTARPGKRQRR